MLSSPCHCGSVSGIMLADVAQAGGTEQGVGHGVEHHVGVGMARPGRADGRSGPRPGSAAALDQPVRVVTDPHSQF